jgi:hypothetical protein
MGILSRKYKLYVHFPWCRKKRNIVCTGAIFRDVVQIIKKFGRCRSKEYWIAFFWFTTMCILKTITNHSEEFAASIRSHNLPNYMVSTTLKMKGTG